MFKKPDIFGFFLVMRHVWTPFWTPKLLPFIESVQKRGSKNGPDERTNERTYETDVTNGLTEHILGALHNSPSGNNLALRLQVSLIIVQVDWNITLLVGN